MKLALPEIPPFVQATVRSIGAFAIIVIWARWRGVSLTARDGTLAGGLIAGVLFGVEFLLIFPALQFTAASRATLFIYTAPFFVALGSGVPARREAARRAMARSAVLVRRTRGGVRRAGCLARRQAIARRHHDGRRGRRLGRDHAGDQGDSSLRAAPAEKVLAYQLAVSIPILALGMLLMGERMTAMPSAWALGWLAYQTFWVVSLTYAVWFAMVQRYSASRLSAFTFLTPLFGVASGHFVLGEPISWGFGLAVALVVGGLVLVNRPN